MRNSLSFGIADSLTIPRAGTKVFALAAEDPVERLHHDLRLGLGQLMEPLDLLLQERCAAPGRPGSLLASTP
jgi:hypothetical protein